MTRQIYCNICGGPFLGDDHTWLGQATLLSTGHRTQNGIEIDEYYCRPWCENSSSLGQHAPEDANRILLRLDAKYDSDYRTFRLLDWNEKVRANNLDGPISRFTGDALYLPVHKACLQLADHFMYTNLVLERAATDTSSGKILRNYSFGKFCAGVWMAISMEYLRSLIISMCHPLSIPACNGSLSLSQVSQMISFGLTLY